MTATSFSGEPALFLAAKPSPPLEVGFGFHETKAPASVCKHAGCAPAGGGLGAEGPELREELGLTQGPTEGSRRGAVKGETREPRHRRHQCHSAPYKPQTNKMGPMILFSMFLRSPSSHKHAFFSWQRQKVKWIYAGLSVPAAAEEGRPGDGKLAVRQEKARSARSQRCPQRASVAAQLPQQPRVQRLLTAEPAELWRERQVRRPQVLN